MQPCFYRSKSECTIKVGAFEYNMRSELTSDGVLYAGEGADLDVLLLLDDSMEAEPCVGVTIIVRQPKRRLS